MAETQVGESWSSGARRLRPDNDRIELHECWIVPS